MMKPEVNLDGLMHEMDFRTSDKLCPILGAGPLEINTNCKGNRCAWWNPHYGGCAIGTAYLTLDYVGQSIAMLPGQLQRKEEH